MTPGTGRPAAGREVEQASLVADAEVRRAARSRGRSSWGRAGRRSSALTPAPSSVARERRRGRRAGSRGRQRAGEKRRSRRAPCGKVHALDDPGVVPSGPARGHGTKGTRGTCRARPQHRSCACAQRGHQARRCPTGAARTCADGTSVTRIGGDLARRGTARGADHVARSRQARACQHRGVSSWLPCSYRGRAHVYCRRSASAAVDGIRRRQARRSAQGLLRQTERETLHGRYPAPPDTAADLSAPLPWDRRHSSSAACRRACSPPERRSRP